MLVETEHLPEEEWLSYRRRGIGGSDVAAILGISPFRTARDLYYDKLNIVSVNDNEENWVAMAIGHLLEDLVGKIFQHKTGLNIYQVKKMFLSCQNEVVDLKRIAFAGLVLDASLGYGEYRQLNQDEFQKLKELVCQ